MGQTEFRPINFAFDDAYRTAQKSIYDRYHLANLRSSQPPPEAKALSP
jgi:hypothetical protein